MTNCREGPLLILILEKYHLKERKSFVHCFSHNSHLVIDCDVLTANCRSSSGVSDNLLSGTSSTTVVAFDWCITNHSHDWWVLIQSIIRVDKTVPSAVCCSTNV